MGGTIENTQESQDWETQGIHYAWHCSYSSCWKTQGKARCISETTSNLWASACYRSVQGEWSPAPKSSPKLRDCNSSQARHQQTKHSRFCHRRYVCSHKKKRRQRCSKMLIIRTPRPTRGRQRSRPS